MKRQGELSVVTLSNIKYSDNLLGTETVDKLGGVFAVVVVVLTQKRISRQFETEQEIMKDILT